MEEPSLETVGPFGINLPAQGSKAGGGNHPKRQFKIHIHLRTLVMRLKREMKGWGVGTSQQTSESKEAARKVYIKKHIYQLETIDSRGG